MYIKTILNEKGAELISVAPEDSVHAVAKLFKKERIGFALVRNGLQTTVGSISERDIIQAYAERGDLRELSVADIMTTNIVTCDIDDTIEVVRDLMTNNRTRHVVVMDGYALAGIASIGDIIKHSLNECKVDTGQMRDYITGHGYQ